MQLTCIIIPLLDVYHKHNLVRKGSLNSATSTSASSVSGTLSSDRRHRELVKGYSGFEFQLKHNIDPLFRFAAYHDFTAENIQFLREVRDFKRKWIHRLASTPNLSAGLGPDCQREMYADAARIYFELVCPATSACSINIDSKVLTSLQLTFSNLHYDPPRPPRKPQIHSATVTSKGDGLKDRSQSRHCHWQASGDENLVAPWASPSLVMELSHDTPRSSDDCQTYSGAFSFVEMDDADLKNEAVVTCTPLQSPMSTTTFQSTSTAVAHRDFADATDDDIADVDGSADDVTYSRRRSSDGTKCDDTTVQILTHLSTTMTFATHGTIRRLRNDAPAVPAHFNLAIFDRAEESIKYLVYTNTWRGFVARADTNSLASLDDVALSRLSAADWSSGTSDGRSKDTDTSGGAGLCGWEDSMGWGRGSWGEELHHGVLDLEKGPLPLGGVDASCAACRRKEEWRRKARG